MSVQVSAKAAKMVEKAKEAASSGGEKGKSGSGDVLVQLVKIPTVLELHNAGELREICGCLYVTFLIATKWNFVLAGLAAGVAYNEKVDANRKAEEPEDLGPPYVTIASETLLALLKEKELPDSVRASLQEWWNESVVDKSEVEFMSEIQSFRVRKPKKQSKGKKKKVPEEEYAKITLRVGSQKGMVAIVAALEALGGIRKMGSAPKSTMEREAKRLLDLVNKDK